MVNSVMRAVGGVLDLWKTPPARSDGFLPSVTLKQGHWMSAGRLFGASLLLTSIPSGVWAAIPVQLQLVSPPDQPVGTTVIWQVSPPAPEPPVAFRFSVGPIGGPYAVVRDFSPRTLFDWTPIDEGEHEIKVTARDSQPGETGEAILPYTVMSRLTGSAPAVSATTHPLIALYSAPACPLGVVRVRFRLPRRRIWQRTPWKLCTPGKSANFYVAGLWADTVYEIQHEIASKAGISHGPILRFRSGTPNIPLPSFAIHDPADLTSSLFEGVLLQSFLPVVGTPALYPLPVATDLTGAVIWYHDRLTSFIHLGSYLVRPLPGGNMLFSVNDAGFVGQVLRETDIAGNTLRETNLPRVREQLEALGFVEPGKHFVGAFHHDAVRLVNGHTLVLASVEQIIDGVDYLADMVVDLNEGWQVSWAFNSFDHLPLDRLSPLDEVCHSPFIDGCEQLFLAPEAKDWTHTNTILYSPSDGNLLLSIRNQDWVVKIDYRDGAGTGNILWKLGKDGDFALIPDDPSLWFSHQHDINFDGERLVLYDNGNTRQASDASANSRGQVLSIDEEARTATLDLNVDLGVFAVAFGSAKRLANGNYHFLSGLLPGLTSQSVEIRPTGPNTHETSLLIEAGAPAYRSYRMRDLYTP